MPVFLELSNFKLLNEDLTYEEDEREYLYERPCRIIENSEAASSVWGYYK